MKFLFLICALLYGAHFFKQNIQVQTQQIKQQSVFIPPPQALKFYNFGFEDIISDVLWVRWIQNMETCGKDSVNRSSILNKNLTLDAEYSKYHRDLVCDQGWSFKMLDMITDLSPKFRVPYSLGGPTLSVLAEDHIGAKKIFDKAAIQFPKDWSILYRAAYHYIFEINDLKTGSQLLKQAADNGAPDWVYSYSAKISSQAGQYDFGISVLKQYLEKATTEEQKKSILEKIQNLIAKKAAAL